MKLLKSNPKLKSHPQGESLVYALVTLDDKQVGPMYSKAVRHESDHLGCVL